MSSIYSSSLRIELIGTGDQAGTWGTTTNTNLGTLMEAGICGYTSVAVASANQALTALDGAADEARNAVLALTTSTGANFAVYAPPVEKTYVVYNASSYTATIYNSTVIGNTTAAGTGVAIPAGKTTTVWSDGTNFAVQLNYAASLTLGTDLAVTEGGTGASTAANARTNLGAAAAGANSDITSLAGLTTPLSVSQGGTGVTTSTGTGSTVLSASPALTGTPTAPTASAGTNTTQIATTAFVTTAVDAIPPVEHASETVYGTMKAWVSGTTLYLQTS
jgi:hypothetical protein